VAGGEKKKGPKKGLPRNRIKRVFAKGGNEYTLEKQRGRSWASYYWYEEKVLPLNWLARRWGYRVGDRLDQK